MLTQRKKKNKEQNGKDVSEERRDLCSKMEGGEKGTIRGTFDFP